MFRAILTAFAAVSISAGVALGQAAPAITVGGAPYSGGTAGRVVLALPFAPPPSGNISGISQSIQQDMVADLTSLTTAKVIAPAGVQPADNEQSALDQARQNHADFVVWGQTQVSGNQMRVTGQLIRVSDAHPLAALKATAPTDNLFPLEDSLSAQVARALPAPIGLVMPTAPQTQPAETGGYTSQPPSTPITPAPVDDSANPYYSYTQTVPQTYYAYNTYYYPGYWSPYWDYPYFWGGVGFYGGLWPYHYGWYGRGWYGGGFYGRPGFGYGYRGGYGGFRGGAFHGGGGFRGAGGGRR